MGSILDILRELHTHQFEFVIVGGMADVLDEIEGLGDYRTVLDRSVLMDVGGAECAVLSIDALIDAKRALGRAKDLQAVTELAALLERRRQARGDAQS